MDKWTLHTTRLLCLCIIMGWMVACQASMGVSNVEDSAQSNPERFTVLESKVYEIQQRFKISNLGPGMPSKHNLWVALISELEPYQEVLEMSIPLQRYEIFTDEYGNQIAEFDLAGLPVGENLELVIHYRIRVNHLNYDLSACQGELPEFFTAPELHIESRNPQILALAGQLSKGKQNTCEEVRAFYDYIGNNLVYSYNGNDWGAQAALGEMGADCTEYASLMIALSRAAGIPARYLEGVLFQEEDSQGLARKEHAWLEVFLPNIGWTPMDPTMGRSSIYRDKYFAALTSDHIVVTRGRNPSALRGSNYWSHIYWPGNSTEVKVEEFQWLITTTD